MQTAFIIIAIANALAALIIVMWFRRQPEAKPDPRLDAVIAAQGEIAGRFRQTVQSQAELQNTISQRLDALDKRLGDTLIDTTEKTAKTLGGISERLTVIDEAQKNITELSGQVITLREVLSNKQSRGAFGQAQMEDIVRDGLPSSLYEFQASLSNGSRPDCIIHMPGSKTLLVVDSKFPLECFQAFKQAATDEEKKAAAARVRNDVLRHVVDIAEKYIIPGETQTPAIMFVPSESIYADLHDGFTDVIQKAHRAQVIVVSPNILMLAINTIQTVMKDARMREQANLIQREVGALALDVQRLDDRVRKLQTHFNQADADIRNILISADKIVSRGEKITNVELGPHEDAPELTGPDSPEGTA